MNLRRFRLNTSDNVLIACNTAHLLIPNLEKRTGIRFDSLLESVATDIKHRDVKTIGLLASPTSIRNDLHGLNDLNVIKPLDVDGLGTVIRDVVNGKVNDEQVTTLRREADRMFALGAEAVLLGCTELEMLLESDQDSRFIRPLALTIESIMNQSRNEL